MSAAEEKTETAPASAAPSGGGGKIVLILTGVNVIATLAMIGILFVSFQKEKAKVSVDDISVQEKHADGGHGAEGGHGDKKDGGHGDAKTEAPEGKGDGHGGGHGPAKPAADLGKMITLDQFTVNLSTPGSVNPKFVRVNVSLEVPNGEAESEVTGKMPQVRNVIIDLFNSKRPADLQSAEGRDYLKEEIRNAINGFLVNSKVKGVFFTNFALSS